MSMINIYFIAVFIMLLLLRYWQKKGHKKRRHKRMQATARRQLDKINGLPEFRQRFAYLRKINHFVFEEMILEALERSGNKVYRNASYTGDGGIDGKARINGVAYIIQAKRYSDHINKQHVAELSALAASLGCKALFCHTGKTRESAKNIAVASNNLEIISGQRLLDMLDGRYIPGCDKVRRNANVGKINRTLQGATPSD